MKVLRRYWGNGYNVVVGLEKVMDRKIYTKILRDTGKIKIRCLYRNEAFNDILYEVPEFALMPFEIMCRKVDGFLNTRPKFMESPWGLVVCEPTVEKVGIEIWTAYKCVLKAYSSFDESVFEEWLLKELDSIKPVGIKVGRFRNVVLI